MSDVSSVLGVDLEELEWQDLAACQGLETNLFYDDYEADTMVAKTIDQACFSCPVQRQCLDWGVRNQEWGVWGGVFLSPGGKMDANRNRHKSKADWDLIKDLIGGNAL